jgi:hypothetical protein
LPTCAPVAYSCLPAQRADNPPPAGYQPGAR